MSSARSLKVKCPTWEHVEAFYTSKLRNGNLLVVRVPFSTEKGAAVTLALELPNDLVVAIDGTVLALKPAADGKKTAIQLLLTGFDEMRGRLEALVADARVDHPVAVAPPPGPTAAAVAQPETEPPPPQPEDAPVDEVVEQVQAPRAEDVRADEREVFVRLDAELRRLRECGAHEVLGVAWDAGVVDIRQAYFRITKRFHPDVFAKYRSVAILQLAQEVFIHVNKAYDRMRDAAVAAGDAIVAGPALLPHTGWMASFDDLGAEEAAPPRQRRVTAPPPPEPEVSFAGSKAAAGVTAAPSREAPAPPPPEASVRIAQPLTADRLFGDIELDDEAGEQALAAPPGDSSVVVEAEGRKLLEAGEWAAARDRLAEVLHFDPRNRTARALYHVAAGRLKLAEGDRAQALTQFETAIAHDKDCPEARAALDEIRGGAAEDDSKRRGLFKRLFR